MFWTFAFLIYLDVSCWQSGLRMSRLPWKSSVWKRSFDAWQKRTALWWWFTESALSSWTGSAGLVERGKTPCDLRPLWTRDHQTSRWHQAIRQKQKSPLCSVNQLITHKGAAFIQSDSLRATDLWMLIMTQCCFLDAVLLGTLPKVSAQNCLTCVFSDLIFLTQSQVKYFNLREPKMVLFGPNVVF